MPLISSMISARWLCAVVALFTSGVALANRGGVAVVPNGGCNACHVGGIAPVVTISSISTGATALDLTVTVTTPNGENAGFNLSASNGTLSNPGPGVKIVAGNATHNLPRASEASGEAIFTVRWSNPTPTQPVTFTAWGNSVDGDLNTTGDRASSTTLTCGIWFVDADGDGRGAGAPTIDCTQPEGTVAQSGDCDDSDSAVHPGATETCNLVDDDCDGSVDEAGGGTWFADVDGDGFGNPATSSTACEQPANAVTVGGDCDDSRATVHPDASEACNGLDDDCNGQPDDGLDGNETWYADQDGDGIGGSTSVQTCAQPPGHVETTGDCDDTVASVRPGAPETCNGVDDDCDGTIDEGLAVQTWFRDLDGDGVGGSSMVEACAAPEGHVATTGDCDDTAASVKPGAEEVCNGADDDCNAVIDDAEQSCDAPPPDAGTVPNGEPVDGGTGTGTSEPSESGAGCGATGAGSAAALWIAALLLGAMLRRSGRPHAGR